MKAKRILLVDDQKFALRIMRDVLAPQGYLVDEAGDGLTAYTMAVEREPELIVMDLFMPVMDGVEACRMIKNDRRTSSIPVIVTTAGKERENLVAVFEAGADDYLTKPFSDKELLVRIETNLAKCETVGLCRQKITDYEVLLDISQAVTSTLNTQEILQIIVDKIAAHIQVKRCSLTRVLEEDGYGLVLASSDNPGVRGLRIDLDKYPEIREVVRTGECLFLHDVKNHPLMDGVKENLARVDFDTTIVLPVIYRCEVIGTLMLRAAAEEGAFSDREIGFCKLVANVSASALRNARLYEKIREESDGLREVKERLELELREKGVFETLFEHASEGLMALNVRGEPVYVNRAALEILGYSRDEALALTLQDFWEEESFQEAMENHMNFFLGRDFRKKYDLISKTKSGEKRCLSVSVSDHLLQGNYVILVFTDVTDERNQQKHLEQVNEHFKGLDQLKSNFINTATHELRIPLTIIHSYCSLIKESDEGTLTERQLQYLDAALESSERLVDLIDDMLDLSRLDSDKTAYHIEAKSIMEPVREVRSALAPLAERSGLQICLEPAKEELYALFDSEKIHSVLTNLIGNAIKFTPKGGEIIVSVEKCGTEVHVSVSDTGVGIPEKYIEKIFDEFCQVKSAAGPKRGSGLGLAICKRIIDSHNGRIWAWSVPDKGSRFTFALPLSTS